LIDVVIPWYYRSMKIAVSIPDDLFESGESLSRRLHLSRSGLYATALAEFLAKYRGRKITERLNAVYDAEDSRLPTEVRRAQGRSVARDSW
jgi:metal-responsive CopG/Arc/MetJ family transcriptional regulator